MGIGRTVNFLKATQQECWGAWPDIWVLAVLSHTVSPSFVLHLCFDLGLYGFDSMNPFIHSVISLSPLGHLIITTNNFLELTIQFPLKSLFPHLFQEIAELTPVDLNSSPTNRVQVHKPCQSTEGPQRDLLCTAVLCQDDTTGALHIWPDKLPACPIPPLSLAL